MKKISQFGNISIKLWFIYCFQITNSNLNGESTDYHYFTNREDQLQALGGTAIVLRRKSQTLIQVLDY